MKKLLLFSFFFFGIYISNAQQASINPNPVIYSENGLNLNDNFLEVVNYADMKNEGAEQGEFAWKRTIVSAPEEWEFPVCDNNTCYFPNVEVAPNAVVLQANEEGTMDVHLFPRGVAGCGTVMIELSTFPFDENNILFSGMYEYMVNVTDDCTVISSIDNVIISKARVYPNPTTDLFQIAELENIPEADEVAIYNVLGKQVKSFSTAQSEFSVGDLPDGMYLVSLISKQDGILKTVRMSKSALRP